jgi:5'-nucleotidase
MIIKPLILVTNDDGIESPGLRAAAEAVVGLAEVLVVAPDRQQTSMSRAFPKHDDVGIIVSCADYIVEDKRIQRFAVRGSPACAVAHAMLELATRRPALCISGINFGENLGTNVFMSGTVGAAIEATSYGIPAIAVSAEVGRGVKGWGEDRHLDWKPAMVIIRRLAERILQQGLPGPVDFLNVNLPYGATLDTEIRMTQQSKQGLYLYTKPERRDLSMPFSLSANIEVDMSALERDSDIYAVVVDRVVSVTAMSCDLSVCDPAGAPVRIDLG